jgi:hypothetical protein
VKGPIAHWDECGDASTSRHAEHGDHSHEHSSACGHEVVAHGDHSDYVHDGHRHAPHGSHYDEH